MRFCCQGPSLAVHTPAKLNLFLEVLGRRPDGYHELETLMVSIGLYDTILVTEDGSHGTRLRCHRAGSTSTARPRLSSGPDNLISQAVERIRQRTGYDGGLCIDLWKRIPLQAGLGGGSSDAAATLVGLNRFLRLGLSSATLHELAAELGSDVSFFLDSPLAAWCRGRGERTQPVAIDRRMHFVVVCPQTGLATADVFTRWRGQSNSTRACGHRESGQGALRSSGTDLYNALEKPARELNPDIDRALDALRGAGARQVLMSGSGTSCFALCRTASHARSLAGRLRNRTPGTIHHVTLRA